MWYSDWVDYVESESIIYKLQFLSSNNVLSHKQPKHLVIWLNQIRMIFFKLCSAETWLVIHSQASLLNRVLRMHLYAFMYKCILPFFPSGSLANKVNSGSNTWKNEETKLLSCMLSSILYMFQNKERCFYFSLSLSSPLGKKKAPKQVHFLIL